MTCVTWCDFSGEIRPPKDPESQLLTWEITLATFSHWWINEILGAMSGEEITIPAQLYVAINSTACSGANQGTELTGDGYGRTAISFERVSDIQRWNPADSISPSATAEWPTVSSFSLHDALTDGNYYAYGNLRVPISVDVTKSIIWRANRVSIGGASFG